MNNDLNNRQIRIFISSTFQDMQAERDYLITKVFPRLQVEASKRDVTIVPLDLRWGVTEEESKTGKVIQICLQEIENSHPFFIGIIGDRYGWCPTKDELEKNEILNERWGDWLKDDLEQGLSVTEIEMQYGVLRSKENLNALFFIKKGGESNNADSEKLKRLKKTVRENGRYPCGEYDSPESLGIQIEKAFMDLLKSHYSLDGISELQKERIAQESFLHSRTDVYIPDEENYKVLNGFLNDSSLHNFVVTGESGLGKTSLIANWCLSQRNSNEWNIIYHFVGIGGQEGDYHRILSRLCDEIRDIYHISNATDLEKQQSLTDQLNDLYTKIYAQKPLLIILDGINQLADIDNAKSLDWLPLPSRNIKNLFSTLKEDKTMTIFQKSDYPCFELQPLNSEGKRELISNYLRQYGKTLRPEQILKIASNKLYNNTLFLHVFLNELINYGKHDTLNAYIDEHLAVQNSFAFFQKVINRYVNEYGSIVRLILSLIAASKKGLNEKEILNLTGVKQLYWSQFYCAFKAHFTIRNGFITFSHQYISLAIDILFKEEIELVRSSIIDYFRTDLSNRSKEELAFQYYKQKMNQDLYLLLLDFDFFNYLYLQDVGSLTLYWKELVASGYSLEDYLKTSSEETYEFGFTLERIGSFVERFFLKKGISYDEEKRQRKQIKDVSVNYYSEYVLARKYKEKAIGIVKETKGESSKLYADMCMGLAYTFRNTGDEGLSHGLGGRGTWMWYASRAMKIYNTIYTNCHADFLINASKFVLLNTLGGITNIPKNEQGEIANSCLNTIEYLLRCDHSYFLNYNIYILLGYSRSFISENVNDICFSTTLCYKKAFDLLSKSSRNDSLQKALLLYFLSEDNNKSFEERILLIEKAIDTCNSLYGEQNVFLKKLNDTYLSFQKANVVNTKKSLFGKFFVGLEKKFNESEFAKKLEKRLENMMREADEKMNPQKYKIDPLLINSINANLINISRIFESDKNLCYFDV